MINRILPLALSGAVLLGAAGCQSGSSSMKNLKGISYRIVKDKPGKTAQVGDIVEFQLIAMADTTHLANSWTEQKTVPSMEVQETTQPAQWQAIFPVLSAGDSAIVEISCDTMLKYNPPPPGKENMLPPWLKKGKKVTLNISLISLKSKADFEKENKEKAAKLAQDDDKTLQDYFTKNNLKPTKTATGLYYIMSNPGSGPAMEKGQNVTMKYKGKLLDGTVFDTNMDSSFHHAEPFTFPVGVGRVIPGWDEGVMLLKKGAKASFYIPSGMAYGVNSPNPAIPANSILAFDVEVTDVKAASAPQPQPQMQMSK